jgi:hypothetical protein
MTVEEGIQALSTMPPEAELLVSVGFQQPFGFASADAIQVDPHGLAVVIWGHADKECLCISRESAMLATLARPSPN